ncbi:hypothetical protein HK100_004275 [Physocladia obscura]|uniref:Major facilitator superfamily (MFS) profile domain-containing protein n=1 Tax=Physocladia obscura TaxID=109957 RepID=A0AAD5XJK9_9FUNG|nr:hypothetical protein HK100_004275 [Physocladia obscura]
MAEVKPKTLWSLYLILILVFINSANNSYDGSMFGSVLSFQEFKDYFCINAQDTPTGRLASIINVGNIIGGFAAIAAPIFVTELSPPHIRGTLVGLYNCFWYAGSFLSRVTVISLNNDVGDLKWRLPLFLQMTPSVIVILTIWLLPESPRYLILKGRDEEATRILAKYHADGDVNAEIVTSQVSEIKNALAVEEATRLDSFSSSMRGLIQILSKKSDLHRLFVSRNSTHQTQTQTN